MSKWNSGAKWNSGVIWDDDAVYASPRVFWGIQVDWNGDGFVEGNEAARVVGLSTDRGRDFLLNSSGNGFETVRPGTLSLTLDNTGGRYDPYNTSSPLYPYILPGRLIKAFNRDYAGVRHEVFTGYISDIQPLGADQVTITAVDESQVLADQEVTVPISASISITDAIESVLTEAGVTAYSIDTLSDILGYWWADAEKALTAIQSLEAASLGTFFIAADGTAKYYKRNRSAVSITALDQSELLKDMSLHQPWEVVKNNINLIVNPVVLQNPSDLWTLQDIPQVEAGQSIEIWATYQYDGGQCPAINVTDPVATTDYTMNSASDGTGVDLTASFTVSIYKFSRTAKLTIQNNSASRGYITLLKVRGTAVTSPDPVKINVSDAASIAAYRKLTLTLDSPWLQSTNLGITLADVLLMLLSSPRKTPTIRIQSRPDKQYLDLLDRVSLTIAAKGIDGAFQVGKVKHQWLSANGQDVLTTLIMEPVVQTSTVYWEFPVQIGVDSIFSY